MSAPNLLLAQKIAVCQHLAKLARANLPLAGELSRLAQQSAPAVQAAARAVENDLLAGKSLAQSLAQDESRDSRILAACIEAGESSGQLDKALESWTAFHLANNRATRSLRTALAYPLLLIVVTLLSLGYVIWRLIPEYQKTHALFGRSMPSWLELVLYARTHFAWVLILLLIFSLLPLVYWAIRRRSYDSIGLPYERASRLRLQGLATDLASMMLCGNVPLTQLVPVSVAATGAIAEHSTSAFSNLQERRNIAPLARETTLLLSTLHAGLMERAEACQHLNALARLLHHQADEASTRQSRWLPMLVAIVVGLITIMTYLFLIYVPWLLLLKQIAIPPALDH
jgi:type II secretory pathway component PulF